jgi:hypothetical protein
MRTADIVPENPRLLAMARDPWIVPGIHRYCDEWCEQCAATERCLLYKCRQEFAHGRQNAAGRGRVRSFDAIAIRRQLDAVEPPMDTATLPSRAAIDDSIADALGAIALEYSTRSRSFADSVVPSTRTMAGPGRSISAPGTRPIQSEIPTASEIVRRFHLSIYAKTTRALVGATLAAGGMPAWNGDAIRSAARLFAYGARSRAALTLFADGNERRAIVALLDDVVGGLERYFPDVMTVHRRAWRALSGPGRCLVRL